MSELQVLAAALMLSVLLAHTHQARHENLAAVLWYVIAFCYGLVMLAMFAAEILS